MHLPQDFIEKYTELLGDEANDFFKTFDDEAVSAFRTNPLKKGQKSFDNAIEHTKWGHYGKISGKSSDHVTGLVYSQEPAAQVVAQVAEVEPGMKVLDLAAAPGGKSTHLLSYLNQSGLLVSNEINTKRSKILVENIERFGAKNVVVTNETPENLAKVFSGYFDVIVLDAPCSGEGMFRKDHDATQYWSAEYPNSCAKLQRSILEEAVKMLAPNGRLVYSTCTWAPEENEDVVNWVLDNYSNFNLSPIEHFNGVQAGINMPQAARMYPHHFKGEGQFVAVLDYNGPVSENSSKKIKKSKKKYKQANSITKEQSKLWTDFEKAHLTKPLVGQLECFGNHLYLLPNGLPNLEGLKIARNGLHLGVFKKNRFEPSYALGLTLTQDEVLKSLSITQEQFRDYVTGLSITLESEVPNGWYQLLIDGNGFGFAKVVGKTVKNYFPKGLRFNP